MDNFSSVIGHQKQKRILVNQLKRDDLSHAYLFTGPEGIGKRTLAEELAKAIIKKGLINPNRNVSLNHADIFCFGESGDQIKISDVRELINQTVNRPLEGEYRVFIVDHADMINPIAQNALLKTIEEPNRGNIFILVTSNPEKLLPTVKSRCQELPFHDLNRTEKLEFLKKKGVKALPEDLNPTPGALLELIQAPERLNQFKEYYKRFKKVMKGDAIEAFDLAEELSKDKNESIEALTFFIRSLGTETLSTGLADPFTLRVMDTLFDLLDKVSYNVNLRLQWEASLIDILLDS